MWSGYANTLQILCSASLSSVIKIIITKDGKAADHENTSIALDYCAEYDREYPDSKKSFFM